MNALLISLIGSFEASVSVLLTLAYGILAARLGLLSDSTARDVSKLCVHLFLPALLIVNVGSQLHAGSIANYVPVFIWALGYTLVSLALGVAAVKLFKLPAWVAPACGFNNTTSLPLLLTTSLATTGILESLVGSEVDDAVERAKSYFLINSCVSNALTFALGPKLLQWLDSAAPGQREAEEAAESDGQSDAGGDESASTESTALLPKPVAARLDDAEEWSHAQFERLPPGLRHVAATAWSMVNPPLVGAVVAVVVGLTPPLHRALFASLPAGGWANAWLTSSVKNMGQLFTALQMFVVGSKLNQSFSPDAPPARVPARAMVFLFFVRFVAWSGAALGIIYGLAKTGVLGSDPMVWWAMCLMPVGPPAMILSSMCEEAGATGREKMSVARLLVWSYAVTPVMFAPVVGALKVCELVMAARG